MVRSDRPGDAPRTGAWVLAATILGSSMVFIEGTVVNVALPALQRALGATVVDMQWIVNSYTLFLAALILLGGSLGDRFGRRRVFMIGVALFAAASAACGLSRGSAELIAARAIQGIGGALLTPGSLAIISATFPESSRGRAIGLWSGFSAITTAIGPVLGGWLIDTFSWRWIFFINAPLAIVVLLISALFVPESRDEDARHLDVVGAVLATLALAGLTWGLLESSRRGYGDTFVIASFAAGLALLIAFIVVERRKREPMVPPALFRSRAFTGANLLTLFLYAALGGALFFLPMNLVQVQGYSATAAGAAFLPFIVLMGLLSRWSGGLVDRVGARLPLVVGPIIAAAGFGLLARPGIGGGYWTTFFPAVAVLGLGMSISVAPLTTTVMNAVPAKRAGTASGVNNAVSRVASLLAIALFGIVMLGSFGGALERRIERTDLSPDIAARVLEARADLAGLPDIGEVPDAARASVRTAVGEAFVHGFRVVMAIAAALALLAAAIAFVTLRAEDAKRASERAGPADR